MHMQQQARQTLIGASMDGFNINGRCSVVPARLQTLTILGDEILSEAFNYGVNCNQIKLRLN